MRLLRPFILFWFVSTTLTSVAEIETKPGPVSGAILHRVNQGDTFGTLSRLYGVSPEQLRLQNGGKRPEVGDLIKIPPSSQGWVRHTVLKGQTLIDLSAGYSIPIQHLREANLLSDEVLTPGTILVLPRAQRPAWSPETNHEAEPVATLASSPRRSLPGSRSGSSFQGARWIEVVLGNGRKGWVEMDSLVFDRLSPSSQTTHPVALAPREHVDLQMESTSLSFGQKLDHNQKRSIHLLVAQLKDEGFFLKADDIANFMALETGGTFDPAVRPKSGGAVGLAQFTNIAIQDMNSRRAPDEKLSMEGLASMTFEEQSVVVGEYLITAFGRKNMKGKEITSADLYSAIFAPRAIGAPLEATVYCSKKDANAYQRNRSLDHNNDGFISKIEMVTRLKDWERRGEVLRD